LHISHLLSTFAVRKAGCGAVGSVRVWGACGRQFESGHPDIFKSRWKVMNFHRLFIFGKTVFN
jgi:hypothetical protein